MILDRIQDPQNLGSIFRTSLGVNVDAIIVPNKNSCRLTNTVREVSKGATEVIPLISVSNLPKVTKFLIQNNVNVFTCSGESKKNFYEANFKQVSKYVHATSRGHEAIQIALGMQLLPQDYAFPYYRDDAMLLSFGLEPYDLMLQLLAKKDDPFSQVGNSPNKNKTPEIWADFISFLRKAVCVGACDSLFFPRALRSAFNFWNLSSLCRAQQGPLLPRVG